MASMGFTTRSPLLEVVGMRSRRRSRSRAYGSLTARAGLALHRREALLRVRIERLSDSEGGGSHHQSGLHPDVGIRCVQTRRARIKAPGLRSEAQPAAEGGLSANYWTGFACRGPRESLLTCPGSLGFSAAKGSKQGFLLPAARPANRFIATLIQTRDVDSSVRLFTVTFDIANVVANVTAKRRGRWTRSEP